MDISLEQGSSSIKLNGSGISAPVRASRLSMSPGAAVVEVALDGSASAIATFQSLLETALYLGSFYAGLPGEDQAYLKITLPDSTVWLAPVISGRVLALGRGPGTRSSGSEGIQIDLVLQDYWESGTVTDCPLSNRNGTDVTGGIAVHNHDDAGHDNFVNLSSGVNGDVPTPAIITFTSATAGLDVLLGQSVKQAAAGSLILECESPAGWGGTLTPTADGNCSNGNYGAFGWNGTGQAGFEWTIDATNAGYLAGRVYRPVLRIRDLVAGGEKIWAYFSVTIGGGGSWTTVSKGMGFCCRWIRA